MTHVVVLGAHCFSGQDFVDLLLDRPEVLVTGISRSPERPALFLRYKSRPETGRYRYVQMDMNRQMEELLALLDEIQPRWIVNFAAQSEVGPSWEHPEHWFTTNCVALARLVNHLRRQKYLERYLHISSPEVYGTCDSPLKEDAPLRPSTPYAASKAAADMLLRAYHRQYGFPVLTVRATNVYGARQQLHKIIPRTVILLRQGRTIGLHGGGKAIKSYIHIRDVSAGELAILERGRPGEIYHLSPDRGVAVRDLVARICEKMGKRWEESVAVEPERPGQDAAYVIDSTRTRQMFGWVPRISLDEGLDEVISWVDQHWTEIQGLPLEYQHQP